tara:strand:- start:314 stop:646 length:333 start_codon:yes stop_codon:yes gene_type:complete
MIIIRKKKTMFKTSIKAQWVGQQVVIETVTNPSYAFEAPTLEAGIYELAKEKGIEVGDIFWLPPLQSKDKYSGPRVVKPFHSVNRVADRLTNVKQRFTYDAQGSVVDQLV